MNDEFKGTSELDEWMQMTLNSLESFFVDNCCVKCGCTQIAVTWQQVSVMSRDAAFEVKCCKCSFSKSATAPLPIGSPVCWPLKNISPVVERLHNELELKRRQLQVVIQSMPAAMFATHPKWAESQWNATTYQWHPTSDVPPLIGLVFENQNAGLEIFRDALKTMNHMDPLNEIRISIIEGQVPGEESRPGYSVHISPDPNAVLGRATINDLVMDSKLIPLFGQWNRHYPIPGMPSLLENFKEEFNRHGEFMLAPVIRRNDGQNYMDYRLGIVKKRIHFRKLHEIVDESDIDALAHVLPLFSAAPEI